MPNKPKIKSYNEFMKIACEKAYGGIMNMTKEDWDETVKARYDRGTNIYNYRIRDFANPSLLGRTGNATDTLRMFARLDDVIANETDPYRKTLAMAVRSVAVPKMEEIMESSLFASVESFQGEIAGEYDITPEARREIASKRNRANRVISGAHERGRQLDTNTASLDELSSDEKSVVLTTLIQTFFDNTAGKDPLGNTVKTNTAMGELLHEVNVAAGEIADKATGIKTAQYDPRSDREKKDFDDLCKVTKAMESGEQLVYTSDVKAADKLVVFTQLDATPHKTHANLILEKNPIADVTDEEFSRKQAEDGLSYSEIEWGESNIDHMVESLYTLDELKALKRAGIEPATAIMVDGKFVDWQKQSGTLYKENDMLGMAKVKCGIVASALNGSKLDICKYVPDGKGGYTTSAPVPVQTDLSMKEESWSFWRWLKQLFGFEVSVKDKVKQANKAERTYKTNPADLEADDMAEEVQPEREPVQPEMEAPQREQGEPEIEEAQQRLPKAAGKNLTSSGERNMIAMEARRAIARNSEAIGDCENEVFAKLFGFDNEPESLEKHEKIGSALTNNITYTTFDGKNNYLMDTLGRESSRIRIFQLYGMTKGYSFEEMCYGANGVDRLAIGREFIDEFCVMKYDEFANAKGLEQNDETRKQYNEYVTGRLENVEMFCAKAYDVLREQEIPDLDPNDMMKFAKNMDKLSALSSMTCDFSQVFSSIGNNKLNPSDPASQRVADRRNAMQNFTYYKMMPLQNIFGSALNYGMFLASHDFVDDDVKIDNPNYDINARQKAYLNTVSKELKGIHTFGEFADNEDLGRKLSALGFSASSTGIGLTKENMQKNLNYIYAKVSVEPSVKIDVENVKITDGVSVDDCKSSYDALRNNVKEAYDDMRQYVEARETDLSGKIADDYRKATVQMNRAIKAKSDLNKQIASARPEKKIISEKISFKELAETDKHTVINSPEKRNHEEKSMNFGSPSK